MDRCTLESLINQKISLHRYKSSRDNCFSINHDDLYLSSIHHMNTTLLVNPSIWIHCQTVRSQRKLPLSPATSPTDERRRFPFLRRRRHKESISSAQYATARSSMITLDGQGETIYLSVLCHGPETNLPFPFCFQSTEQFCVLLPLTVK
jgi:hypothetical protein